MRQNRFPFTCNWPLYLMRFVRGGILLYTTHRVEHGVAASRIPYFIRKKTVQSTLHCLSYATLFVSLDDLRNISLRCTVVLV